MTSHTPAGRVGGSPAAVLTRLAGAILLFAALALLAALSACSDRPAFALAQP